MYMCGSVCITQGILKVEAIACTVNNIRQYMYVQYHNTATHTTATHAACKFCTINSYNCMHNNHEHNTAPIFEIDHFVQISVCLPSYKAYCQHSSVYYLALCCCTLEITITQLYP